MLKLKSLLVFSLVFGTINVSSAQSICMCAPGFYPTYPQKICIQLPGGPACPHLFVATEQMDQFLGPITPEQVGSSFNIRFEGDNVCQEFYIMTFPANEWDPSPDTRVWKGFNRSGGMIDDDGGLQYNCGTKVTGDCNGDPLELSIDFYPNQTNVQPFYIYITKRKMLDYIGTQKPSTW